MSAINVYVTTDTEEQIELLVNIRRQETNENYGPARLIRELVAKEFGQVMKEYEKELN